MFCTFHLHLNFPPKIRNFSESYIWISRQKKNSKKIWTTTNNTHTQNQWPPLLHYGLDRQWNNFFLIHSAIDFHADQDIFNNYNNNLGFGSRNCFETLDRKHAATLKLEFRDLADHEGVLELLLTGTKEQACGQIGDNSTTEVGWLQDAKLDKDVAQLHVLSSLSYRY